MKFKICTTGYCINVQKPTRRAACTYTLECVDEHGRKATRTISTPLGNSTKIQADLKALKLALQSIKPKHRDNRIDLLLPNSDVLKAINTKSAGVKNTDLLNETLAQVQKHTKLKMVVVDENNAEMLECIKKAKATCSTQESTDTGTII